MRMSGPISLLNQVRNPSILFDSEHYSRSAPFRYVVASSKVRFVAYKYSVSLTVSISIN